MDGMTSCTVLKPVTVTLALVSGPNLAPGEHPDHRIEATLVLDATGRLDAAAWIADPAQWPARRTAPDAPDETGVVHYDSDEGWTLQFWQRAADRIEAPPWPLETGPEPLRPGEYVTVVAPEGGRLTYRVVGVTAAA